MHTNTLHGTLHRFCEQAAETLAAEVAGGAEVGFEVIGEGGRGARPALYCYRPLSAEFIARHDAQLRALPAFAPALHALAAFENLAAYSDSQARAPQDLARDALMHLCARVFVEGEFAVTPERFEPAFRELDRVLVQGRSDVVLLALLRGITTEAGELPLADGVILAPPECLEHLPPEPSWTDGCSLVVAVSAAEGVGHAISEVLELQSAMRLFSPGIACEPIAWLRGSTGSWRAVALGGGPLRAGAKIAIAPEQEDELRAFCSLVRRRRPVDAELAWAHERFELGLEREDELVALSDHLMALRALLEPEGMRSGRLAGRLAALCAVEDRRDELAERVARAIALEAAVIGGHPFAEREAHELAFEVEGHLRALLRDVICGHLQPDLAELADELILGPYEDEVVQPEAVAAVEPEAEPEQEYEYEYEYEYDDDEPAHGEVPALPQSSLFG